MDRESRPGRCRPERSPCRGGKVSGDAAGPLRAGRGSRVEGTGPSQEGLPVVPTPRHLPATGRGRQTVPSVPRRRRQRDDPGTGPGTALIVRVGESFHFVPPARMRVRTFEGASPPRGRGEARKPHALSTPVEVCPSQTLSSSRGGMLLPSLGRWSPTVGGSPDSEALVVGAMRSRLLAMAICHGGLSYC